MSEIVKIGHYGSAVNRSMTRLFLIQILFDHKNSSPKISFRYVKRNEIETIIKLNHTNISFPTSPLKSITDHFDISLEQKFFQLKSSNRKRLAPVLVFKCCKDILNALNYLHTKIFIVKRNLRPCNVKVSGNFETSKLCDFSLCVPVNKHGIYGQSYGCKSTQFEIPLRLVPEIYEKRPIISTKLDIFCLGLIIYEAFTFENPSTLFGRSVLENITAIFGRYKISVNKLKYFTEKRFFTEFQSGKRPTLALKHLLALQSVHCLLIEVYFACINLNPNRRPSAKEVLDYICQNY